MEVLKVDDLHVPFGSDGCLDLDLDLVCFRAFVRVRIFLDFGKVWPLAMIFNMVEGGGPSMEFLQEFFCLVFFRFLAFDFFRAIV